MVNTDFAVDIFLGLICKVLHEGECPCAAFPESQESEELLVEYTKNYTRLVAELAASGRYDTKDDFTVVLQPYYRDFNPPRLDNGEVDLSFFAPDCFHPSAKAHAYAATGLWNNMLEPVGKKTTTMTPGEPIKCPTKESPFLFTNRNSN
jgi:phospholipase B1, membrane-associated